MGSTGAVPPPATPDFDRAVNFATVLAEIEATHVLTDDGEGA